jgi:hypothetical protein
MKAQELERVTQAFSVKKLIIQAESPDLRNMGLGTRIMAPIKAKHIADNDPDLLIRSGHSVRPA